MAGVQKVENFVGSVEISAIKSLFIHPLLAYNFFITGIPSVLNVHCQASSLPQVSSSKIPIKFRGRELYFTGNIAKFEDWTITIREDIYYRARSGLETWHNIIANNMINFGAITPVVTRDLDIYMLAPGVNIPVAHYRLYNAFPYMLGAVNIDQNNDEEVVTYEVTFSIDAWERLDMPIIDFVDAARSSAASQLGSLTSGSSFPQQ